MTKQFYKWLIGILIVVMMFATASVAADKSTSGKLHDAEAEALLKKMSVYMSELTSIGSDFYVIDEQMMDDGFKLSVLRSGSAKIQLPNKLYVSRKGVKDNQEVFFDGDHLVLYLKSQGAIVDIPVKGGIDDALDIAAVVFGTELPGRDIFSKDVYTPLIDAIKESSILDSVRIGDVVCRQLAFRTDEVDLQLWVQEGDQPLPCRYSITSKWTVGAPQYTITFSNWQINQELSDSEFAFTPPSGTKKITVEEFRKALQQKAGSDEK